MGILSSGLTFIGGVVTAAVAKELVARLSGGPRVDMAIADVSIASTKHRSHKSIPVPDSLRVLLAEGPTSHVGWES